MRKLLLSLLVLTGCVIGDETGGGGGGDGDGNGDGDGGGDGTTNPDPNSRVCSLPQTTTDAGNLNALKTQQCNVPGTMGAQKWYRVSATLQGSMDFIQIELWDGRGAFTGGAVTTGTYQLTGTELDPARCGVCVRGLGDKGTADQKEYFATSGSVQVTAIGGGGTQATVTLTNATFAEINPTTKAPVAMGCSATVNRAQLAGTVVATGGGGGGGGCPATIGD